MIRVAFCDDDAAVLTQLAALLDRYQTARSCDLCGTAFSSPLELLAEAERGARFDILFLDILLPGESGIATAAELRQFDQNAKIIFLTSSADFAVQSYTVDAFFYQLKPIDEEPFFRLMDAALAACDREQEDSLILRCRTGLTRVELRRLEYCEVLHRTLSFHLTDGTVLESTGSLDELCRQLSPYGGFLRPHRSYLINLEWVASLNQHAVVMESGAEIPIPRGKVREIRDAYLDYVFAQRKPVI